MTYCRTAALAAGHAPDTNTPNPPAHTTYSRRRLAGIVSGAYLGVVGVPLASGVAVGLPAVGAAVAVTLLMALATLTLAAVVTDAANRIVTAAGAGDLEDIPVGDVERLAVYMLSHGGVF